MLLLYLGESGGNDEHDQVEEEEGGGGEEDQALQVQLHVTLFSSQHLWQRRLLGFHIRTAQQRSPNV
jgi:hypothetical protein